MDVLEKVRSLPSSPGVYLMKDSHGGILYVGKSKNLKNRVSSYFQNSRTHPTKIKRLVKNIRDLDYICTDTEFEALMLECKLIKEIQPIYNRQMKNTRNYAYIHISKDKKISITSEQAESGSQISFGPFHNKNKVEQILKEVQEFYKIYCSNPSGRGKPCLNYSLGLCVGVCKGGKAVEYYNQVIYKLIKQLSGSDDPILDDLTEAMLNSASQTDYKTAAKYRDLIESVTFLARKEKIQDFIKEGAFILAIETLDSTYSKVFLIKQTEVIFSKKLKLSNTAQIQKTISQLKIKMASSQEEEHREIGKAEIDQAQIIYNYLRGGSCRHLIISRNLLSPTDEALLNESLTKIFYE